MFGMGLLIKIALAVLLVGGILGGIYLHFKHDRENEKLIGQLQAQNAQLTASLANRDADVLALNQRIRERNEQVRVDLAAAEQAQAKAKAESVAARAEKKQSDARLKEAQRKYQELLNNDQNLQNYSRTPVPAAVLERLRSANGERDDDTVRAGPNPYSDCQADSCRTTAGLPLPPGALGW